MERREAAVIDAVRQTEGIEEGLDDIVVAVPRRLVQCSVSKLQSKNDVNFVQNKCRISSFTLSFVICTPRPSSLRTSREFPAFAAFLSLSVTASIAAPFVIP